MTSGPDPVFILRGCESAVTYLRYQSNSVLFSGDQEGYVYIWDLGTRRQVLKLSAHPGYSVLWIDFIEDDIMVTQGRDGIVQFWNKTDAMWTKSDFIKSADFGYCSCSLVDQFIAVPSDTMSVIDIYNLESRQLVGKLQPDPSEIKYGMCMTIRSVDNKPELLIGYENGCVALWDVMTLKMVNKFKVHTDSVMCLDYCSRSNFGISGSVDDKLISWKIEEGKIVLRKDIITTNPGFNSVLIRKDHKIVATAGWDSLTRIFSVKTLKPLAVLSYHKESIQCLTFSPDNTLACGSKDHHISLWEIYK